jgi:hypothetical protein
MLLLLHFLLIFFISLSFGCPNNCTHPNGFCNSVNVCICSSSWTGDDCSISDVELQNSIPVSGHVFTRQWRYFHVLVTSQQLSLEFDMNQTSTSGDIDCYLRSGQYPTRQDYDERDISSSKHAHFHIRNPHGVYYFGVYGFISADFSLMAFIKTNCNSDCSGHGTCNLDGRCLCESGYTGVDCSSSLISLMNNETIHDSVPVMQWKYFSFQNSKWNSIVIFVNETEPDADKVDCDVYVSFQTLPSFTSFDFRDNSYHPTSKLRISGAFNGTYYIGIYGYQGPPSIAFTLHIEAFSECPNRCSGASHGVCTNNMTCSCMNDFVGENCEKMTSTLFLDGKNQSGYVSGNNWNSYHIDTFTTSNIYIQLYQSNTNEDCDLYVRLGQPPTLFDFDYRDVGISQPIISFENPGQSTWYIGVYGYRECTYDLNVKITKLCLNNCTDALHGTCRHGLCNCIGDWVGADCSVKAVEMNNSVVEYGSLRSGSWNFYRFLVTPETKCTIVMSERESKGVLWLFASLRNTPTHTIADWSSNEQNTDIHRLRINVEESRNVTIGVFGSVLGSVSIEYKYQIVVWQSRLGT